MVAEMVFGEFLPLLVRVGLAPHWCHLYRIVELISPWRRTLAVKTLEVTVAKMTNVWYFELIKGAKEVSC